MIFTTTNPPTTTDDCPCCGCLDRCPSISLEEWARIMCMPIFGFFQMGQDRNDHADTPIPLDPAQPCHSLTYETRAHGGDISGRRDVFEAILRADNEFYNYAGYWPAPTQMCDEYTFKLGYGGGTIRTRTGKIKGIGRLSYTSIGTVTLTPAMFHDTDADGVLDTVQFTFPKPTGVTASDVKAFFLRSDWIPRDPDCRHQIRPIVVQDDGVNLIIEFGIWLAIKPILYQGYYNRENAFDPNELTNYVAGIELFREWIDASQAITIMRRTDVGCACNNDSEVCYKCENVDACIVNANRGLIRLDISADETDCFCQKCAHRICVNYVAGDCGHSEIIAHLAATYLCQAMCCSPSMELKRWQADYVGVDQRGRITTSLTQLEHGNPFGTLRGQVEAYRYLRNRRMLKIARV